jgi:hypothetical protein
MKVFVLLFNAGSDNEGIHTLSIGDRHIVLMFVAEDDATRYAMLLEAQDFRTPTVESIDREEVEEFCRSANYECRLISRNFQPINQHERFYVMPPETNATEIDWDPDAQEPQPRSPEESQPQLQNDLEQIRKRLENLL